MPHTTPDLIAHGQQVLTGNYGRLPVVMARGQGSTLFDTDNRQYVDFFAGFGGSILGHCHPDLVRAVTEQANTLWAVGNTFWSLPQLSVADHLNRTAFTGQAFFAQSGMEANEAAVKLARLKGGAPKKWKTITFNRSFHGRSLAMIAATGNPKTKEGFDPPVPGFINVEPDFDTVAKAVDNETAAILMEPVQGEGGVNLYPEGFAAKIRHLCNERGITLIFDEVWTGVGRSGKWYAYQHFTDPATGKPVEPDIMTLGKALGGGLPVSAMFAKPDLAKLLVPGRHGSTLGANPICMAAAKTVFDVITRDDLLNKAAAQGQHALARLRSEKSIQSKLAAVRGKGLFIGIEFKEPPAQVVEKALAKGLVINLTASKVIRLAPALTIPQDQLDKGLDILIETIRSL